MDFPDVPVDFLTFLLDLFMITFFLLSLSLACYFYFSPFFFHFAGQGFYFFFFFLRGYAKQTDIWTATPCPLKFHFFLFSFSLF